MKFLLLLSGLKYHYNDAISYQSIRSYKHTKTFGKKQSSFYENEYFKQNKKQKNNFMKLKEQ